MAESYTSLQTDTRNFGAQQARLLDDLNRPDFSAIVTEYLQDAMRIFQRKAFFFNEADNTLVPAYAATTYYPQGACIQQVVSGTNYVFCALQTGVGLSGASPPVWPSTVFTVPSGSGVFPPPTLPYAGAVQDNTVVWANIGAYQTGLFTNLSTVYNINQYVPPLDYVAPYQVQITTANLRLILQKISFGELSSYDVIRPAPISAYPRFWAYFQQQIYFWVYPNGFYPITLNYYTAPQIATLPTDVNFWTTTAERLIRKYAQASIQREVLGDVDAAMACTTAVEEELAALKSQAVAQQGYTIPAGDW